MANSTMMAEQELVLELSSPRARVAVGLLSMASMLLELSLTRLFSVVLFYHFAFLAISIALLGLGAGGVAAYLKRPLLDRYDLGKIAGWSSIAASLATLVVLEVVLYAKVPLNLEWKTFWALTVVYVCAAIPFALVGLALSIVFSRGGEKVPKLYAADLAGGALACMAIVPLLNFVGGPNTVLAAAVFFAAAGVAWMKQMPARKIAAGLAAFWVVLIAINFHGRVFDIIFAKGMYRDPKTVQFSKWNAISRVEVDNEKGLLAITIDADANTYIMGVDPDKWHGTQWEKFLMATAPSTVNELRPHGTFAVIGPGGGVDVLRALGNGSPSVTGIEINPIIATDIMRRDPRYVGYSQGLYLRPDVHIHVSDGRSYIRQSHEQFDVVQMTLVDTWASTAAGAFALSENNLYTVEAFGEYFQHLKPDGMLAITRWEFKYPREALRVVSNAIVALKKLGVKDPSMNFIVVSSGALNEDGRNVLVLAKKSAFTPEEENAVYGHLKQNPTLQLIYAPRNRAEAIGMNPANPDVRWNPFTALIVSNDPEGFAKKYAFNVSPVYDDAPFFFFTVKPAQMFGGFQGEQRGMDWKVNMGVAVLGIVLVLSLIAVALFLVLPMWMHVPAREVGPRPLLYFLFLGLGYILVEIALIQRFVLFLGNPTYALTVVIFLMLLLSGAGSAYSSRFELRGARLWALIAAIAGYVALLVGLMPVVFRAALGTPIWVKLLISAVMLAPGAFLMGMPFPSGLRRMKGRASAVEWAWALNAAASVLGSVLAIVVAMEFGLTVTLLCGAVSYLAAGCSGMWRTEG